MKKYLITSREYYTDTPAVFRKILQDNLKQYLPDFVLYRDKTNRYYKNQAEDFLDICRNFSFVKSFLHQDIELAYKLGATGVHLTSLQVDSIKKAKDLNLEVIVSTHSLEEILKVEELGANYVTYSPIFITPNKGKPKGILDLQNVVKNTKINIFALGGITTQEEVKKIEKTDVYGFASIRYFY